MPDSASSRQAGRVLAGAGHKRQPGRRGATEVVGSPPVHIFLREGL